MAIQIRGGFHGRAGLVCLVLACVATPACRPSESALTAEQILRAAADTYAAANTYRDHGVVERRMQASTVQGEGAFTLTFATAFRRPSEFRLTYRASDDRWAHALLATDAGVEAWVEGAEIPLPYDSLSDALRGTVAESYGVSILVPPMLFSDSSDDETLLDVTEAIRLQDEKLESGWAYVVRARWHDRVVTTWVDRRTYLVVRCDLLAEEIGPDGQGRATTRFILSPEVDVDLPAGEVQRRLWELGG